MNSFLGIISEGQSSKDTNEQERRAGKKFPRISQKGHAPWFLFLHPQPKKNLGTMKTLMPRAFWIIMVKKAVSLWGCSKELTKEFMPLPKNEVSSFLIQSLRLIS